MRLLTNLLGAVEQLFLYDAYGADLAIFNTASGALASGAQPRATIRYNGEYFDNPSQQYYFRARQYDPLAGRLPSLDPYAGDIYNPISFHKYGFVHGDPVQGTDPSGWMLGLSQTLTANALRVGLYSAAVGAVFGAAYGFAKTGRFDATVVGAAQGAAGGFVAGASATIGFAFLASGLWAAGVSATEAYFVASTILESIALVVAGINFGLAIKYGDRVDIVFAGLGLGAAGAAKIARVSSYLGQSLQAIGLKTLELPEFDGQTRGYLVTDEGQVVALCSGVADVRFANYPAAKHVEGKAAIWIRDNGSKGGVVYHNHPKGTCQMCHNNLSTLLPQGATLRVVPRSDAKAPDSYWHDQQTVYTGNANLPKPPKEH